MENIKHTRSDEKLTLRLEIESGAVCEDVIDLGQEGGIDELNIILEHDEFSGTPANLMIKVQASADGSSFADVAGLSMAATSNGYEAKKFRLPVDVGRYLKLVGSIGEGVSAEDGAYARLKVCV